MTSSNMANEAPKKSSGSSAGAPASVNREASAIDVVVGSAAARTWVPFSPILSVVPVPYRTPGTVNGSWPPRLLHSRVTPTHNNNNDDDQPHGFKPT